jgi:hypothetical protein
MHSGKDMTSNGLSAVLASDEIEALVRGAVADAKAGRTEAVAHKLAPLRRGQSRQPEAASALLWIVDQLRLQRDAAAEIVSEVADSHMTSGYCDAALNQLASPELK